MRLSHHDQRILAVLSQQLRCATDSHLARICDLTPSQLQYVIRKLRGAELLTTRLLPVVAYELGGPLARFRPDDATPDMSNIAWLLKQRWQEQTVIRKRVCWATERAAGVLGGNSGRHRQPLQLIHDLGVAEMFTRADWKSHGHWLSEDMYRFLFVRDQHDKHPDGVCISESHKVTCVYEFGGRYSRERLMAFHDFWAHRSCYEIW